MQPAADERGFQPIVAVIAQHAGVNVDFDVLIVYMHVQRFYSKPAFSIV